MLDGQYHIESLLGKGGMGAVFLARHPAGDRVAIKVLPPEMRNNAEWLRRFRREGQAARRFRHPNAVTVYDLRTASDGTIYLVMEYVEGHTLYAEMNARGQFTPPEAVSALDPIMSVLNEAHAMGVVHRDLKPENIMFGKAGTGGSAPGETAGPGDRKTPRGSRCRRWRRRYGADIWQVKCWARHIICRLSNGANCRSMAIRKLMVAPTSLQASAWSSTK